MSPEELLNLGFAKELVILVTSALPILELRGSIPVAIGLFDFPWYYALLLACLLYTSPSPRD